MANSEKHILIISSWYPSERNPFLGNFVERQAELLARNFKVTVVNTIASNEVSKISIQQKESSYRLIEARFPNKNNFVVRKYLEKKALNRAFIEVKTVTHIVGNVLLPKGWQFILAKKHFNCPLIYVEHGSYFRDVALPSWRKIDHILKRQIERQVDAIISVSDFLKVDLMKQFPQSKIDVIGNHVDEKLFTFQTKDPKKPIHFLHISTLDSETKGFDGIIDACVELKKSEFPFQLTIISDEDYTYWQARVADLNLNDSIVFKGPLDWEELPKYYHETDAFILNSRYESFSIVLAEAWSTGTPTITTSVGIAHPLDNSHGIQTEIDNIQSLVDAMMKFNPKNFDGIKISSHAAQYSSEAILEKWTNKINELG